MAATAYPFSRGAASFSRVRLRDVILPKEHGSWSLALEPIVLGLSLAPSLTGVVLAGTVLAGFFARRPLKIAVRDANPRRRRTAWYALGGCAMAMAAGVAVALSSESLRWTGWLLPFALLGGVFLAFDLENSGREGAAEVTGAAAFSFVTPALIAAGGQTMVAAGAGLVAMAGRAVPTVVFVRACVRGRKAGALQLGGAVFTASLALAAGLFAAAWHVAPWTLPSALALLLARTFLPRWKAEPIRARTLGFQELALGIAYVAMLAASWPR